MPKYKKKIVIVGGNFAGLTAASAISDRHQVTVIDPGKDFQWTPNIHEILSGVKAPGDVLIPRSKVVEAGGHAFLRDAVRSLDVRARTLQTEGARSLAYDACIIASGGVRHAYGIPGVEEHTIGFRQAQDCRRIEAALKRLSARAKPVSIVIIGGGVSGIEALGEILRNHRQDKNIAIHVVEVKEQILPGLPAALAADVRAKANRYRVKFHTDARIEKITPRRVYLASGEVIAADLTIWTAGMVAPQYLEESGLIPAGNSWVPVKQTLQSRKFDNVFVAGDSAGLPEPLRKQAYYAIDTGEYAGANAERFLSGRPLKRFRPARKPMLIAFGDLDTYFVAGQSVLASKYFAAAKESVYQLYMARVSSSLSPLSFSRGVAGRFASAVKKLVIPELTTCGALKAVRDSRVVQLRG